VSVSSALAAHPASNVTDGNAYSYWESHAKFPQALRVDLGSVTTIGRLTLLLPPVSDWNRRIQTLSIFGSRDGNTFTEIVGPTRYVFDANSPARDTVGVRLPRSATRYVELRFSANAGWLDAQLAELQVWSAQPSGTPGQTPARPGRLPATPCNPAVG
jgi:hypothetical protein